MDFFALTDARSRVEKDVFGAGLVLVLAPKSNDISILARHVYRLMQYFSSCLSSSHSRSLSLFLYLSKLCDEIQFPVNSSKISQ